MHLSHSSSESVSSPKYISSASTRLRDVQLPAYDNWQAPLIPSRHLLPTEPILLRRPAKAQVNKTDGVLPVLLEARELGICKVLPKHQAHTPVDFVYAVARLDAVPPLPILPVLPPRTPPTFHCAIVPGHLLFVGILACTLPCKKVAQPAVFQTHRRRLFLVPRPGAVEIEVARLSRPPSSLFPSTSGRPNPANTAGSAHLVTLPSIAVVVVIERVWTPCSV